VTAEVHEQHGVAAIEKHLRVLLVALEGVAKTVDDDRRGKIRASAGEPAAQAESLGQERDLLVASRRIRGDTRAGSARHHEGENRGEAEKKSAAVERYAKKESLASSRSRHRAKDTRKGGVAVQFSSTEARRRYNVAMATVVDTLESRRFTVEEYHRMGEAGILSPGERVELLWGVVCPMSPKGWAHVVAANQVLNIFRDRLGGRAGVYKEDPLRAEALDSEPEPDVMVCGNPDLNAFGTDRMNPLLIIEVAESSLPRDLRVKPPLYAAAAVPEYWVVNLVDRVLEVFRDLKEGRYLEHFRLAENARVSPKAWPGLDLEISDFFPHQRP
jgi:Uma2 family endonuclease